MFDASSSHLELNLFGRDPAREHRKVLYAGRERGHSHTVGVLTAVLTTNHKRASTVAWKRINGRKCVKCWLNVKCKVHQRNIFVCIVFKRGGD